MRRPPEGEGYQSSCSICSLGYAMCVYTVPLSTCNKCLSFLVMPNGPHRYSEVDHRPRYDRCRELEIAQNHENNTLWLHSVLAWLCVQLS